MIRQLYHNPRFVILALLLIVTGGATGFLTRPRLEDPKSGVRWGAITTYFPGASPQEVESRVSEPIEKALEETKGIRFLESSSLPGVSVVYVRLADRVGDVEKSWTLIRDKLSEVSGKLPDRATTPVLVNDRRWDSYTTIVALVDHSTRGLPPSVLARWGKELENRLRFVPGTRFTEIFALPQEEIRVEIPEESLAALQLTIQEAAHQIRQRDSEISDASTETAKFHTPVRLAGDIENLDGLKNVVLRGASNGGQCRLGDIATLRRTEKKPPQSLAIVDGQRAVVIASRMEGDIQINAWTASQRAELDKFESLLPAGLELRVLFQQEKHTDQRAWHLYTNLGTGMLLVILVVWFMMGWRAAIPICSALPLTLLGVCFLMIPFEISLHQMSLTGMILALGMLIDNPIIVVDQIQRQIDLGASPEKAIVASIRQLTPPLLGSNVTTILGFSPILLLPGPTGEYLKQFGWSAIACLVVSLLLSLTLLPILAVWCLGLRSHRACSDLSTKRMTTANGIYQNLLSVVFRRPVLTLGWSVVLPICGFLVTGGLQEQFFPPAERDQFLVTVRLPSNASIRDSQRVARNARQRLLAYEEVESVALFVGTNAPKVHYSLIPMDEQRPNFAEGIVQLKRGPVDPELIRRLQHDMDANFPEAQIVVMMIEQGPSTVAPIELRISGPSLETLAVLGEETRRILSTVPGVIHTRSSLDLGAPELGLHVRQHEATSAGLTDGEIAQQMQHQLNGMTLTRLGEEIEEIPIRVQLENAEWSSPERVLSLPLTSPEEGPISLASVADWSVDSQLVHIPRRNSSRCNTISAYVAAGELPIAIEHQFREALESHGFHLPPGYCADFGGESEERNAAVGNLLAYGAIIAILMLAVLVLTFRSFRQAALIGVVGLLSIGLGLLSLWLSAYPLGIVSIIGIMGMMGLAINDSIVVLSDCNTALDQGISLPESVAHSTRHVLTTSLTTVAGVLPLILAGGDFWPPMMIVIAGGVVGATLLALGFTPACYLLIRNCQQMPSR